jgi:NSS family neurotransmitter:Na+ symporter
MRNRATFPEERERWRSRTGFLLATLGAAVGLGNVWRFSYVAGENGGAAFLLVYVLCVVLIGFPLLLAELAIGRAAERESAAAFERLAPEQPWRSVGRLGVLIALIILSYYAVIAGWALRYFAVYVFGTAQGRGGEGFETQFRSFIADPIEPILWQFAIVAITIAVVWGGVERGIEAANKLLMPALAAILLALAARSFVLPGFSAGLGFLFRPDWEALARPGVYLAALGQAFFSIGLAMGVMVTYGSYVPRTQRLPGAAFTIAIGDTLFAIVAGIVIFPAVFSYGVDPAQGPVLAFVVLPEIFSHMAGGTLIAVAFFLLLSIAAVTSAVSLLEVPVAYAMQRFGWRRGKASVAIGLGIFAIGIPASLGFGVWEHVRIAGKGLLDAMDFFASNLLLPLNGIVIALFAGWRWRRADAVAACDLGSREIAWAWRASLRYLVPALVAAVLVQSLLAR